MTDLKGRAYRETGVEMLFVDCEKERRDLDLVMTIKKVRDLVW